MHGYHPDIRNMSPFFIAYGPSFKKGFVSEPINSVDIYPLMCHLLGIKPAPNNGSFDNVKQMLKYETDTNSACKFHFSFQFYIYFQLCAIKRKCSAFLHVFCRIDWLFCN